MLTSFSPRNLRIFENYPQMILEKYSALILTSNFENFREFLENPQKFSKPSFLRAVGTGGGGHLSTTPPYIFSKECENRGALEKALTRISFWQPAFVPFHISGSTEWVQPQYFILSYYPGTAKLLMANFRELFENPQEFSKLLPSFSPRSSRVFEDNLNLIFEASRCSHS